MLSRKDLAKTVQLGVRISEATNADLVKFAKLHKVPKSALVRDVIELGLERYAEIDQARAGQ